MDDRETESADEAAAPVRILVVDDIADNRNILARYFEKRGYEAATAENGRQALLMISEQAFDAVLLDVVMPDMDGLEVLTRIRASWNSVALPVVMVTALTDAADVVRALSLGANDYLTKPVDFEVAFARVASQVQRRHDQKRFEHLVAAQRDARELIEAALKERFRQLKADTAAMARTKLDPAQKALLQNIQSCGAELFRTASGALEKATDGTRRAA